MTIHTIVRTVVALVAALAAGGTTGAQFGGFGPRGGDRDDLEVVNRFDADDNGWLDRVERDEAREFVATEQTATPGGRGRRGGRPGPAGTAAGTPGPRIATADVDPLPSSLPFYAPDAFRTIFFEFEDADWEEELAFFRETDVEIPATMIVDGRRYENVGMRFRGNSSYMMVPAGLKRSFNVTVDYVIPDQGVQGYRTLNLLNGINDPTMMRTVLFQRIAGEYLPAARANFVRVVINGGSWGVFQNVEQLNRSFVEDRFDGENGVRWKVPGSPGSRAGLEYVGDDPEAYKPLFEIKNKDNDSSWASLINLTKVLNTTPLDELESALEPVLDVDEALRFLALDVVLANSDGYWTRGSDYYLYLDLSGRFHVLPGDTNETFSTGGRGGGRRGGRGLRGGPGAGGVTLDLLVGQDDASKPLRSRLLAIPSFRATYLAYCREIAQTWLDWGRLGPIARDYHELIASHVEADTRKLQTTEQFLSSLDALRTFVDARREYVLAYSVP